MIELKRLTFDKRQDEVVLLDEGKLVGFYMPAEGGMIQATMARIPGYFPDPSISGGNQQVVVHYEISAQLWLVGTYLTTLSRMGSVLPVFQTGKLEQK